MNEPLTKLVKLRPEEVLHLSKPREGFAEYAGTLIAIYAAHRDEMRIKGVTPEDGAALEAAHTELVQIEKDLQKQAAMATATRALRASNLWDLMLRIYGFASVASINDIEIARDISDFEEFMKNGPRKKPVAAPTEPASPPAADPAPVAVAATPAPQTNGTSTTAPTLATAVPPITSK